MRALFYCSQRISVWRAFRRCVASGAAAVIRGLHPSRAKRCDAIGGQLADDGLVMLPPLLPENAIVAMVGHLEGQDVVLRDGRVIRQDAVPISQPLADFSLATVVNCPHAIELANHPRLLQLATAYLHCAPTISSIGLRWSYPSRAPDMVQQFHRDTDDWRFIRFFPYLTDVDELSGPHVFVRRSHLDSAELFARVYSEDEVVRRYGAAALVSIIGRRGAMFLAHTSGIHKGAVPMRHPRLVFAVGYSLLPVFAYRYAPVRLTRDRPPLDPYINRLIIAS